MEQRPGHRHFPSLGELALSSARAHGALAATLNICSTLIPVPVAFDFETSYLLLARDRRVDPRRAGRPRTQCGVRMVCISEFAFARREISASIARHRRSVVLGARAAGDQAGT